MANIHGVELHEKVTIVANDVQGIVDAILFGVDGIQYRVCFGMIKRVNKNGFIVTSSLN